MQSAQSTTKTQLMPPYAPLARRLTGVLETSGRAEGLSLGLGAGDVMRSADGGTGVFGDLIVLIGDKGSERSFLRFILLPLDERSNDQWCRGGRAVGDQRRCGHSFRNGQGS